MRSRMRTRAFFTEWSRPLGVTATVNTDVFHFRRNPFLAEAIPLSHGMTRQLTINHANRFRRNAQLSDPEMK
jgi:hypothetical protein